MTPLITNILIVADSWLFTVHFVDKIIFMLYLIAVCYLFIFALGSTMMRRRVFPKARKEFRYAIVFFTGSEKSLIMEAVDSMLAIDYPKDKYDIVIVTTPACPTLIEKLSKESVKLIVTEHNDYKKSSAIKLAMSILDKKDYDAAIIMDSDSTVDSTFLYELNNAYYSGSTIIQTHRIAKSLDSDTAMFSAISEEINNSIFRKGHVNLGFSSALIGSGMAFNFDWLQKNLAKADDSDIEKQLEQMLLEQSMFIEYLSEVYVYGRKASGTEEFNKQRTAWLSAQTQSAKSLLTKFPKALMRGNYDYCEKLFQWLLPSRTILIGTLVIITLALLIISWGMAIKWLAISLLLITAFSIATPDRLIDARFIKALRSAPMLFTITVYNSLKRRVIKPTYKDNLHEKQPEK